MNRQPLRAEIQSRLHARSRHVLALPPGERERVLVAELVESVLASSPRLPPVPKLAEQYSERLAERVRSPREHRLDCDGDARERLKYWSEWYAKVREFVVVEGVDLLAQLARVRPEDAEPFDALLERIRAATSSLRALALPWWPSYDGDRDSGRALTLLEYAENRLAKLETWQIREQIPHFARSTRARARAEFRE